MRFLMSSSIARVITWAFAALLILLPAVAMSQSEDVADEIVLGLNYRTSVLREAPAIRGTREDYIAQNIFSRLLNTTSRYAPALPYSVTVIDSQEINAFVTPGGHVFIPLGMAKLLGEERGLWAAVLGHELGHNIRRHHYKALLREIQLRQQIEYYQRRAAAGDSSANWTLLGLRLAGGIAEKKLSRDDEHEADKVGLTMMVEAGYHPAFAITMYRRLRMKLGDDSKFGAFFGSHPRWETREQRAMKAYDDAVAEFESAWPDAASSPGGEPPVLANIGKVRTTQDKTEKQLVIEIPYTIRNGKDLPVFALVSFSSKKQPVPSNLPDFRDKDGNLFAWQQIVPKTKLDPGSAVIKVPTATVGGKDRKLKATVFFVRDGELLAYSDEISVSFPKP